MKKHQENINKYRSKQDVRTNAEQARLEASIRATIYSLPYSLEKAAYEELNAELKRDITKLMNDADNFFAPLLATLFSVQTTFYGHLYNRKNANLANVE